MKWWICNALWLLACNSETSQATSNNNDSTASVHASATDTVVRSSVALMDGSYATITKKDTVTLSLHIQDTVVTGQPNYQWAEKDDNPGTIKGHIQDSLLIADYTFESESLAPVREVVF